MAANPDMVTMALAQVEQGFAAFALLANAKKPITPNGFKNATRNPDWIRTQLGAPAAGNYGIIWPEDTGERVLALDLDNGSDGRERPWQDRLLELIGRIGPLPATKATTTPSGGRHAFYRWPADVPIPPGDELFGFTVRWPGRGYLVGPGSSINGVTYLPGPTHDIAELPRAWVDAALADRRRKGGDSIITVGGAAFVLPNSIPAGRRYPTVRDYVASRYNSGLSEDELWALVVAEVAPRFTVPKSEADLRADFDRATAKLVQRLGPPNRHTEAVIPAGPLRDAPLTEFISTPVEWLWAAWLPRGVVTLMDGNPGVSKSTLVADLVARITSGRGWPDETPGTGIPARVMWITTEDDPGRVLRPRIEAAGGDASLVRFVISEVVFPSGAGAFRELVVQRSSEPAGLALVVLDPLFSHIEAGVRTIADAEMRKGVMNPLGDAAEAADVAILVVRHFNKDAQASALNRGAGSLGGIVGAARALWSVTVDKEDETGETKAVGVAKLNYARAHLPLRYRVVDRVPPGWVTGTVSGIEWLGESSMTIDELLGEDSRAPSAVAALEAVLTSGAVDAVLVPGMMRGRGFGDTALRNAAKRLGVVKEKSGFQGRWTWRLPDKDVEDVWDTPSTSLSLTPACAGGDQTHTSSTSLDSLRIAKGVQDVEGGGSSRAPGIARAREAGNQPALTVVPGGQPPTVACHFPHDHSTSWRQVAEGRWICVICAPEPTGGAVS